MIQKKCKGFTKILSACMLTAVILLAAALPAQAAEKATVRSVSGVKFQKASGTGKAALGSYYASVSTGTYFMYLNSAGEKTYLVSTKDGKKYAQTELRSVVKKLGKLSKRNAESISFGNMSVLDGEVVLCGSYGEEKSFMLTTKNGKKFTYYKMPDFKEFSYGAHILKAGSKYVWLREYVEGQDEITGEAGLVQDGPTFKVDAAYRCYVSDDKKTWYPKKLVVKGVQNGKDEILYYNDTQRKNNKYLVLNGVMSDGEYLYFGITYRPHSDANEGEASESYVYRTKDFETCEKVALSDQPLPKVTKRTAEHIEDLLLTKSDVRYGAVTDWNYQSGSLMGAFALTRGSSADGGFQTVFSYDPGAYSGRTNGCLYNWEETGKNVSLLFERTKDNSLFVSKDGQTGFKEYQTSIQASHCRGIMEDARHGYKILCYQTYTESDEIDYLLFSKNGFAKTYRVKLPKGALSAQIKGNRLLVMARKGNYYISLSDLYKKMG